jgi:hypothetical protein
VSLDLDALRTQVAWLAARGKVYRPPEGAPERRGNHGITFKAWRVEIGLTTDSLRVLAAAATVAGVLGLVAAVVWAGGL